MRTREEQIPNLHGEASRPARVFGHWSKDLIIFLVACRLASYIRPKGVTVPVVPIHAQKVCPLAAGAGFRTNPRTIKK